MPAARHPDAVGDLLYGAGDLLRPAELDADVDAGDGLSAGGICWLTSLFTFGGTAGILLAGWMMDRWEAHRVVAGGFMLTMALILLLGMEHNHIALFGGLIFLMGIAMNGAQSGMQTLAATFYPTECRATGIAWMQELAVLVAWRVP